MSLTLTLRRRPGPIPLRTTPLLVENGKVSPDVEFTPTQLLKVFEYLADKHNKSRLHDAAWGIVQAIDTEDYTTGAEILDKHLHISFDLLHINLTQIWFPCF